jgi:LysM repeat protein
VDAPEHVVRAGETLSIIARRYGVSIEDLVSLNGISDPDVIDVGQRLVLSRPLPRVGSSPRAPGSELDVALDQAEVEIAQARFDEALRIAEAARQLVSAGAGRPETLARVEEITAYIHAARGDEDAAIHAYRRLLELDPNYRPPPSTPPKVRMAYERALALPRTDVGAGPR